MRSHAKAASAPSTHRENNTFSLGVIAAMLACAAAFLGIGAPAASAAPEAKPTFAFVTTFSSEAVGDFVTPSSPLGVDSSGNIFLPEEILEEVHIYAPDPTLGGTPLTTVNGGTPLDIAVDPITDDLYVKDLKAGTIKRYTSDGNTPPVYTVVPGFSVPAVAGPIAVDPLTHDLLVADPPAEAIRRYDTTGAANGTISTPGLSPSLLAGAPDGSLFIAGGKWVVHLSNTGSTLGEFQAVNTVEGRVTALAFDSVREIIAVGVFAGFPVEDLRMFTLTGSALATESDSGNLTGLAFDPATERLYGTGLAVFNESPIRVFEPAIEPGVGPVSFSGVTSTGFHLEAEVDPDLEGEPLPAESAVSFEYRVAGDSTWTPAGSQAVGAPGAYGVDVGGLEPNQTYEAHAIASNALVTASSDPVKTSTLMLPPLTETFSASDVTEDAAVLNGAINSYGLPTTYHFEYGTTTAYGSRIPLGIEAVAGAGRSPKSFSRTIFGLAPGTTYHFRLVATSSAGTVEGLDRTFTTVGVGGILHRAYEQVTPAAKEGANVYRRIGFQASIDGNAFAYFTQVNEESAPVFARSISLRGSSDWHGGIDVDPPAAIGPLIRGQETLAISDDFTHALVVSNLALTPDAIEGGANLYLEDIAARSYRFVGGSDLPGAFELLTGTQTTGNFQGGSRDYSWMVFASPPPLLPGAPKDAIYRWSEADGLEIESVLPNGEPSAGLRADFSSAYETISADGLRVYYTAIDGAEEGIYLRESGGPPKAISVSHVPGDPATPQPAILLGINEDGRYAFLYSRVKLTSDAPESDLAPFLLYRYDRSDDSLKYLNAEGQPFLREGAEIKSASFGISDNGDTLYFRSNTDGAGLSVWHDGVVNHVTSVGVIGGYEHPSPNGRYFVYNSNGSGGGGAVYLYDVETNETSCASCLPDGTPVDATLPWQQDITLGTRRPLAVDDRGTVYFDTPSRLVAADVNGVDDVYSYRDGATTLISPGNAPYTAYISDVTPDGRNVFFTTAQKLVGRDNDGEMDIYDARVDGGLPAQSPPPPQECLRDDCKATPNAGPELPFGGSEALSGPENVKPKTQKKCAKGKRAKKVKGKVRCVKKHKASKNKKGGKR